VGHPDCRDASKKKETLTEIITSPEFQEFLALWVDGLEEQYEEAGGDPDNVTPLREIVSSSAIVAALIAFAQMGGRMAEDQLDDSIAGPRRERFEDAVEIWANDRVGSLLVEGVEASEGPFYPLTPQTLDKQSRIEVAAGATVAVAALARGTLIAEQESRVSFVYGQRGGGVVLGARRMKWGETRTPWPRFRDDHLAIVDEIVGINDQFSIGVLPNEEWHCRCQLILLGPLDELQVPHDDFLDGTFRHEIEGRTERTPIERTQVFRQP